MGGGQSFSQDPNSDEQIFENKPNQRRKGLFEKGTDMTEGQIFLERLKKGIEVPQETRELIGKALGDFFFISGSIESRLDMILASMEKEEFDEGHLLMIQEEPGDRMYVVESGRLDVFISGKLVRSMNAGTIVGELALLYNAPRSATVQVKEHSVLWSLKRDAFKVIEAVASSASLLSRSSWLNNLRIFQNLDPLVLTKFAGFFGEAQVFEEGDVIVKKGEEVDFLALIEKGSVCVHAENLLDGQSTFVDSVLDPEEEKEMDRLLDDTSKMEELAQIARPLEHKFNMIQMHEQKGEGEEEKEGKTGHQFKPDPFRSTISSLNEHEVLTYIQSSLKKQQQMDEIEEKGEEGEEEEEEGEVLDIRTAKPFMISRLGEERELPVFYEGSCVGNGLLNHYASDQNPDNKPPTDVKWPISPSGSEQPENTQEMAEAITIVRSVTSPVNIVAASKGTTVSKLPFHVLENILSDISILTYLDNPTNEEPDEIEGPRRTAESMRNPHMLADDSSRKRQACRGFITFLQQQGIPMNLQQFNNMGCIGKGSFGTVIWMKPKKALMDDYVRLKYTEADMKEEEREEKMSKDAILKKSSVAVKMISKQSAANSDQFSHVMNEKNILIEMSHPFILDIFGTFQDPDTLYFVTEVLPGGDLWSVMYECKILKNRREVGLPRLAVKFYIGCLVLALVHVHGKGVAFRDLKPENVMVDSEGYVRLIDFGFAKKVPWTEIKDGKEVIQPKTFTLCGTPEYLAPEFIFNSGHDHSVDLWSLGVVMFEMIMGFTPFISKKPNDMTGLFTNIALTKKKGVRFPSKFQSKSGDPNAKSFITELLKADYATRLGNGPRGSQELKEHPYFDEMDFARLLNKQYNPPWVPLQENPEVSLGESLNTEKFTGDDSQFADF